MLHFNHRISPDKVTLDQEFWEKEGPVFDELLAIEN